MKENKKFLFEQGAPEEDNFLEEEEEYDVSDDYYYYDYNSYRATIATTTATITGTSYQAMTTATGSF